MQRHMVLYLINDNEIPAVLCENWILFMMNVNHVSITLI